MFSTKTISSIVEGVLGWPCTAHHPVFREHLHEPKACQGNGSYSAVVNNWALEPDRSGLHPDPSIYYL